MPSIFERVSKNMAKKLGGKDLRPVKHLLDAKKFRHFNILRNSSQSRFWEQPDIPVEYSLMDILDSNSSVPETTVTGPIFFSDSVVQKQKAGVGVNAGVEVGASGEFTQSHGSTLEIQSVSIPPRNLESLQNSKLLAPEPSFLKNCRKRGDNLYVVTEAVELINSTVLHDKSGVDTSGKLCIPWATFFKGEGQGQVVRARETTLTVPQGTVMAYRRKQLVIKEEGCEILISEDAKQKTFQDGQLGIKMSFGAGASSWRTLSFTQAQDESFSSVPTRAPGRSLIMRPHYLTAEWKIMSILPIGRIEEPVGQDFKRLQMEVSWKMQPLAQLSKDGQHVLFHSVLPMLRDRGALRDLMDMLELDSAGHLDGPGGRILNEVRQHSRHPWVNLQDYLLYFLEALMVLSDTQLDLLAQSMEKRILPQLRELVKSILEPNFKYPWNIPFTLQPELLAPLQGEALAITYGLLEECGLKMALNSPRSTWDLEAKMPLSALYGVLSLLQQLAEA